MKQIFFIAWLCLVTACGQLSKPAFQSEVLAADSIHYAKGFTIRYYDGYIQAEIIDPWDTTNLLQRYLLIGRDLPLPKGLPKGTIVRTPVQNLAVYASVHVSILEQLGELNRIIGVCEPQYMSSKAMKEQLQTGRVADLGMATSPNVEKMIDIGVECIIASPFQNSNFGAAEKLGIPIIEGADYMESSPLGRAEWGRFYGLLFNKQVKADSIFRGTEDRYLSLKELAATASVRPTVLTERRYGSFWYVPGNESYIAHFLRDAGAANIFDDEKGVSSIPLAFETVLDKAIHADFWLLKYNQTEEMTYRDLRTEYTPYELFDAFKNRNIYTCNTGSVPYYEESPMHPDYLLKDLIAIFHPELLPDYKLRYYKKME
ncbi:iron ABC transporter substrate-binding protein [Bacteroidia bacterium]|nr:iron ABC transporter substrate-binding protein [Bacteroidia bacterium]